ncbi:EamA family transporter [Chitinophagaceae bacterium MMS25-I14]
MKRNTKAYLAFIFICIVWGTTYLALRVGVMHYPPFLFAGVRQVISGVLLAGLAILIYKKADWSIRNLLQQAFIGFLLITMGNGLVTWAEKVIPSGIAALICSMMPISAVIINIVGGKERLNLLIVGGMLLGFAGVAFIFKDNVSDLGNNAYLMGIITLLIATTSWAFGSLMNKKRSNHANPIFNSGLQLFFGGVIMLVISPVADDYSHLEIVNKEGLLAMLYLIVFGSVLAFAAYMYALKELPVGLATSYAYVNPLVAVLLGHWWLGETLNWFTALAFVSIICGVYLVNRGYKKQQSAKEQLKEVTEMNARLNDEVGQGAIPAYTRRTGATEA